MPQPLATRHRRRRRLAVVFLASGILAATVAITGLAPAATASSHREAPLISADRAGPGSAAVIRRRSAAS